MIRAAMIERTGGREVIEGRDIELAPPGPGEVRLRHGAVGLNMIDTYHRDGTYKVKLPSLLGSEAAGTIEAVGEGVTGFAVGQRAGTFGPRRGAYATHSNLAAEWLLALPEDISDEVAAATMLKGCTAEFLVERCGKVHAGQTVLVHAAAGGVGQLLVPWLKAVGATVIGSVGDAAKAELAEKAGADHVILYGEEDVGQRVHEITGGTGAAVVFDGVGAATWGASLASAAKLGLIVSFGNSSGPVTGVALSTLANNGSLFVTRPSLYDYYAPGPGKEAGAARLWEMIRSGVVPVTIGQRYPLEQVAQAHADLKARKTTGSTILVP